jgi:hypothetical protein
MPENVWVIVDRHARTTPQHDRSGYIRSLVEADLLAVGKHPGTALDPDTELLSLAEELGHAAAIAALREQIRIRPAAARAA